MIRARALAREVLASKEPDIHVLARRSLRRLDKDLSAAVLLKGWAEILLEENRWARNTPAVAGESRLQRALRARRPTPSGWQLYADCTVTDLDAILADYDRRIDGLTAERGEVYAMREQLAASSFSTVGELLAAQEKDLAT